MKKIMMLLILISFATSLVKAQENKNRTEFLMQINLESIKYDSKFDYYSTNFFTKSRKRLGSYFTINFKSFIDEYIKIIHDSLKHDLIFSAENDKGDRIIFTYNDINDSIVKILPQLMFKPVQGGIGDTVSVSDINSMKGWVDLNQFEKEFEIAVKKNVYLQVDKLTETEINNMFKRRSIIFPVDITTKRWISGVTKIKVYRLRR